MEWDKKRLHNVQKYNVKQLTVKNNICSTISI